MQKGQQGKKKGEEDRKSIREKEGVNSRDKKGRIG